MHISSSLSPPELAALENLLANYVAEKGPIILGAQLGQYLAQALKPRTVQHVGGLKKIVATELQELVRLTPGTPEMPDLQFEILSTSAGPSLPTDLAAETSRTIEVAGRQLWRIYSNPRLEYVLLVDGEGRLFASTISTIPDGYHRLTKPDGLQFRMLAEQFADRQTDPQIKDSLKAALAPRDFYDGWIKELRRLRGPTSNLLREWEISKSDFVAKQLREQLLACGLDPARTDAILDVTRPVIRSGLTTSRGAPSVPSRWMPLKQSAGPAADSEFRQLVHRAIDLMSIAELRELKISAGLLYDASRASI